jgi:hypothetical protein
MTSTPTAPNLPSRPARARRLLLVVSASLALVVAVAAAMRPAGTPVPDDLDLGTVRLGTGGLFRVGYETAPTPPPVGTLHTWTLTVTSPDGRPVEGADVRLDADMPQHGHGLPTVPRVTGEVAPGRYLVEGMKFQMGGWWVVDVVVEARGVRDEVRFDLLLGR